MVYLLNFHKLSLGLLSQLRSPIWCQFISALRAVKEAKPCCSDKILLRWILQYWAGPDYYTENIEPVITAECSWNGEVHSLIILGWPLAYLKHTHKAVHESQEHTHTHTHTHTGWHGSTAAWQTWSYTWTDIKKVIFSCTDEKERERKQF